MLDSIPDMMLNSSPTVDLRDGMGQRSRDCRRSGGRNEAVRLIRRERQGLVEGSSPRTSSCTLDERWSYKRMGKDTVSETRQRDQHMNSSLWRSTERAARGWATLFTRALGANKGDTSAPLVRSWYVAMKIATYRSDEFYAATPPLEALRLILVPGNRPDLTAGDR